MLFMRNFIGLFFMLEVDLVVGVVVVVVGVRGYPRFLVVILCCLIFFLGVCGLMVSITLV